MHSKFVNAIEVSHIPLTRGLSAARLFVQDASLGHLLFAVFEVQSRKRGTLEVF